MTQSVLLRAAARRLLLTSPPPRRRGSEDEIESTGFRSRRRRDGSGRIVRLDRRKARTGSESLPLLVRRRDDRGVRSRRRIDGRISSSAADPKTRERELPLWNVVAIRRADVRNLRIRSEFCSRDLEEIFRGPRGRNSVRRERLRQSYGPVGRGR